MPGPYIHIAVAEHVSQLLLDLDAWPRDRIPLPQLPGPSPMDLGRLARDHPNYFALGAIGPDMFFFLPDFRALCINGHRVPIANSLIGVLEFLDDLYKTLDEWILEDWERYFGPGSENVEETISRLTGDLSTVVSDILGSLASIEILALMDLLSQSQDWWGKFSLGLNRGFDNQDFLWSDMLHYRRTSQFGHNLWLLANKKASSEDASGDEEKIKEAKAWADRLRAYALGYMTHLATDTTGHPFVNEKCGGPFRTHWQSHHLIENHMDAQTYDDDHGTDTEYKMLTESALHYKFAFKDGQPDFVRPRPVNLPPGQTVRDRYVRRRRLDLDSEMPDELAQLLADAMERTYDTGTLPQLDKPSDSSPRIILGKDGRPEPVDIQHAYLVMFRYMKHVMVDGFAHEKPNPPSVFPNLDFPLLTDPHDAEPGEGDTDMSLADVILAILRFIFWLIAVAVWLATVIPAFFADLATYIPRLVTYYSIQLPLYYILKAERSVLVMTGYLLPMQDEIDIGLVRLCTGHQDMFLALLRDMDDALANLEDAALAALQGKVDQVIHDFKATPEQAIAKILGDLAAAATAPAEPFPDPAYPHSQPLDANGDPDEYHHPWVYPTSPVEMDPTIAGPYGCGDLPHVLLAGDIPGNQQIRAQFERAGRPQETDAIAKRVTAVDNLGDPVNFSSYLIWQLTRPDLPDVGETRITDWNLDADRGYAYKCWDWNRYLKPEDGMPMDPAHHVLQDDDGHLYLEPCTPPSQSVRPGTRGLCAPPPLTGHDPKKPLLIHYTDRPDPGCDPRR